MLTTDNLIARKFETALPFDEFVALGAAEGHDHQWRQRHAELALDEDQTALVRGFTRVMNVLCLTGTWCGDCALQGAAMQRIAEANPEVIDLRFILRTEEHADLIVPNPINAGFRVPVSWFMAEDLEFVSRFGDRTLSRYRSMARKTLGGDYVVAPAPEDPVRTVLGEMLDEFERVQLLLRLSPRLRQKHGD